MTGSNSTIAGARPHRCLGRRRRRLRRDGYLYVAVLVTTLMVAVMATGLVQTATRSRQSRLRDADHSQAVLLARAEIHRQLARAETVPDWTTEWTENAFSSWRTGMTWAAGGRGRVRHRVAALAGGLNNPLESIDLTVHAQIGQCDAAITVTLDAQTTMHPACRYGVTCLDQMDLEPDVRLVSQLPVQVGDGLSSSTVAALTAPRIEVSPTPSPSSTVRGTWSAAAIEPVPSDVLALNAVGAVEIPSNSLGSQNGDRVLRNIVLTSTRNPYGQASPVYRISMNGNKGLRIENCRIEATLVVQNVSEVSILGGVIWTPPPGSSIALATDSEIEIRGWSRSLSELTTGVNFNPAGAPLDGRTDSQSDDVFDTRLEGMFFSVDDFEVVSSADTLPVVVRGAILCETLHASVGLQIYAMDDVRLTPPPGLVQRSHYVIRPGTWRHVATPP